MPQGPGLGKLTRNQFYEAVVESGLDPTECNYEETNFGETDKAIITHSSGSKFVMVERRGLSIFGVKVIRPRSRIRAEVADGPIETYKTDWCVDCVVPPLKDWATQVKQIVEAPDYWEDLKRNREFMVGAHSDDFENTPFTHEEQDQIAAQLHAAKKFVADKFELTSEQLTHIEERLDEAAEASKRMGRKDWLLLFSGTIFSVIITDIVTPSVAEHIFTMVVHGIGHLFTGGSEPPQVPPPILT